MKRKGLLKQILQTLTKPVGREGEPRYAATVVDQLKRQIRQKPHVKKKR